MSKKGGAGGAAKGKAKGGGGGNEVAQQTNALEALVLADSFDTYLRPVSLDVPRALMPLVNVPLIEYTLELLASNGVTLAHVVCCAHSEQIKRYLERSRWRVGAGAPMQVQLTMSKKALNAGDALREMYAKGVLRNDFVLVSADVVATLSLKEVLRAHREARAKDKEVLMTLVMQPTPAHHASRAAHDQIMLAVESVDAQSSARIVAYERDVATKSLPIALSALVESATSSAALKGVIVRHDLLDTRIAICAPEVLFQFQDNFDYPDVPAFVRGVVHEEILGAKVHAFVMPKGAGYAARVNAWRQYAALTRDVVQRWTWPLVPDANMLQPSGYRVHRDLLYRDRDVTLARSATVGAETVLGAGTVVDNNAQIQRCVIGKNCQIGAGAVLIDAILWDNVVIDEGARVEGALLANRVHVDRGVSISRGCILGEEVHVGEGAQLPPHTLLTSTKHTSGWDTAVDVGRGGQARRWIQLGDAKSVRGTELWPKADERKEADADERAAEDSSDDEAEEEGAEEYVSGRAKFFAEVADTVSRAFEAARHDSSGAVNLDSVRLEVGSLKLVYDFSFTDTAEAILAALLQLLSEKAPQPNARGLLATALKRWAPLMDVYLASSSRDRDEVELLHRLDMQTLAEGAYKSAHTWTSLLLALADATIIQRSTLLTWAEEVLDDDEEDGPRPVAEELQKALKSDVKKSNGDSGTRTRARESGESDDDEETDLFDDTTDGWFGGGGAEKESAGKAWWDDDGDEKKSGEESDEEKPKNPIASSGSFWAADDDFVASDDD